MTGDRPDKTDHLTGNRSRDDNCLLARSHKAAIPRAQTHLCLPGDVPDALWQTIDAIVQFSGKRRGESTSELGLTICGRVAGDLGYRGWRRNRLTRCFW